jgi:hypothetical protein
MLYNVVMRQVTDVIDFYELARMAGGPYQDMVRGVIDVRRNVMALDAALHADLVQFLVALGSYSDDIWGFTLYPDKFGTPGFIVFDAPINVRPQQRNRSLVIEDDKLRNTIITLVNQKIRAHTQI